MHGIAIGDRKSIIYDQYKSTKNNNIITHVQLVCC